LIDSKKSWLLKQSSQGFFRRIEMDYSKSWRDKQKSIGKSTINGFTDILSLACNLRFLKKCDTNRNYQDPNSAMLYLFVAGFGVL
jgi:hypothetical protein